MIVIMRDPVSPLTLCEVRPVGVVNMSDESENDDKVICVLVNDPIYDPYNSFEKLPDYERDELHWFFTEHQKINHDEVEVKGIEGVQAAHDTIKRCVKHYQKKHEDEA